MDGFCLFLRTVKKQGLLHLIRRKTGDGTLFTKYVKSSGDTRILLIYLLLNNYDIRKIKYIEETEESRMFGLKIKKVYGITEEYVDVKKIDDEIESIQNPIICSPQSYEYYADSPVIYRYKAENGDTSPVINDMGVISKCMIITEKYIVSDNRAKPLRDAAICGFTFFRSYVLYSDVMIGKWHLTYNERTFTISYNSDGGDGEAAEEEILYSAIELDKTSTYKMVIYIIKKVAPSVEKWEADNFIEESYELAVNNE